MLTSTAGGIARFKSMELRTKVNIVVASVALVILITFMILNRQVVELNLMIARVEMPRSVMLIGVLILGFLMGWIARALVFRKRKETS